MKNFFKRLFSSDIEYVSDYFTFQASDEELLKKLRSGYISNASGNKIVLELLERLIEKKNRKVEE